MSLRSDEELEQTFLALTARWRKENGILAIGVPQSKLLKATKMSLEELKELLERLKIKIQGIGLDLVEYIYEGELWYSIRSNYVCPTELTSEEEALLGAVIAAVENSENKKALVEPLKKKLVNNKYLSDSQFDRLLRSLEELGYIQRKNKAIEYGPRTLLEFPSDSRKHIAEETHRFIF